MNSMWNLLMMILISMAVAWAAGSLGCDTWAGQVLGYMLQGVQ
jgi:hypothetical protein